MNVLVIDVGGTHVKVLATGQTDEAEVYLRTRYDPRKWWRA